MISATSASEISTLFLAIISSRAAASRASRVPIRVSVSALRGLPRRLVTLDVLVAWPGRVESALVLAVFSMLNQMMKAC